MTYFRGTLSFRSRYAIGALVPLNIFEMRYRAMFNHAWEGNKKVWSAPFVTMQRVIPEPCSVTQVGIVMFNAQRGAWARVGTVAEVVKFQSQPDGRIVTLNEGARTLPIIASHSRWCEDRARDHRIHLTRGCIAYVGATRARVHTRACACARHRARSAESAGRKHHNSSGRSSPWSSSSSCCGNSSSRSSSSSNNTNNKSNNNNNNNNNRQGALPGAQGDARRHSRRLHARPGATPRPSHGPDHPMAQTIRWPRPSDGPDHSMAQTIRGPDHPMAQTIRWPRPSDGSDHPMAQTIPWPRPRHVPWLALHPSLAVE